MYYPDNKEYITFLFSLLDEFAEATGLFSFRFFSPISYPQAR